MEAVRALLRIVRDQRAYLSVAYLLARLPLAVAYLVVILGLAGIVLFPLGLLMLILIRGFAGLEREIAGWRRPPAPGQAAALAAC